MADAIEMATMDGSEATSKAVDPVADRAGDSEGPDHHLQSDRENPGEGEEAAAPNASNSGEEVDEDEDKDTDSQADSEDESKSQPSTNYSDDRSSPSVEDGEDTPPETPTEDGYHHQGDLFPPVGHPMYQHFNIQPTTDGAEDPEPFDEEDEQQSTSQEDEDQDQYPTSSENNGFIPPDVTPASKKYDLFPPPGMDTSQPTAEEGDPSKQTNWVQVAGGVGAVTSVSLLAAGIATHGFKGNSQPSS
jgi:hypothetical protein